MKDESWSETIEVDGVRFQAQFVYRPFREGVEVRIKTSEGVLSIAELGFGERAMIEKARSVIRARGLTPGRD